MISTEQKLAAPLDAIIGTETSTPYVATTPYVAGTPYDASMSYGAGMPYVGGMPYAEGMQYVEGMPYMGGMSYDAAMPYMTSMPYVAGTPYVADTPYVARGLHGKRAARMARMQPYPRPEYTPPVFPLDNLGMSIFLVADLCVSSWSFPCFPLLYLGFAVGQVKVPGTRGFTLGIFRIVRHGNHSRIT